MGRWAHSSRSGWPGLVRQRRFLSLQRKRVMLNIHWRAVALVLLAIQTAAGAALGAELKPSQKHPERVAFDAMQERMPFLSDDDDKIDGQAMDAMFEHYLRLHSNGPLWAKHTDDEKAINLQQRFAARKLERAKELSRDAMSRRLQSPWEGASAQAKDESLVAVMDVASGPVCSDPLAENSGEPLPCTYTCEALRTEYFPGAQAQARCFMYDPASSTWPEVGGQNSELLSMRQQRLETHTYVSAEDAASAAGALQFTVGRGRECRNVTIISTFMSVAFDDSAREHTEEFCVLDGAHEYNHTVDEEHTVEVVGYAHSGIHDGAGGITAFVVGECTDVLIRVTTTNSPAGTVGWVLDDEAHNGPWHFDTQGVGVHEQVLCMFDNAFTLTRPDESIWQGTVAVVGFAPYFNTITIPNEESWIVQGSLDPITGLPVSLDARLKSGTANDLSHANVVLRHVRFSGQTAAVDVNKVGLGSGGAFEYDGGSNDHSDLVKLTFIKVVFDHNIAEGGGAVYIDGYAGLSADSGIAITFSSCTFFRNFASQNSGGIGVNDVWPLQFNMVDTDMMEDQTPSVLSLFIGWGKLTYLQRGGMLVGTTSIDFLRTHFDWGKIWSGAASGIFIWPPTLYTQPQHGSETPTFNISFVESQFVNWLGYLAFAMLITPWPLPVAPLALKLNYEFVDSSIVECVGTHPGALPVHSPCTSSAAC